MYKDCQPGKTFDGKLAWEPLVHRESNMYSSTCYVYPTTTGNVKYNKLHCRRKMCSFELTDELEESLYQ